jgi:hypothetical protein
MFQFLSGGRWFWQADTWFPGEAVDGFKADGSQGDDNFRLDDLKNRFQVGRTISNFTSGGAAVIAVLQKIA